MTVRFWGVRGSIPTPGPSTARYGGNTSCVSVDLGSSTLILDAGTGIRELGKTLWGGSQEVLLILSHIHWDHIQGFPFFSPIYEPGRKIHLFPTPRGEGVLWSLLEQMDGSHFPVTPDALSSRIAFVTGDQLGFLRGRGFGVSTIATNHPGGGQGYRVDHEGRSVVYLTDNELEPPYPKTNDLETFAAFCKGASVLIHDAQYVDRDMPLKHGWGHSLVRQACDLAAASGARHLVLFHHDPDRTDLELDAIESEARTHLRSLGSATECTAAFEGLKLCL